MALRPSSSRLSEPAQYARADNTNDQVVVDAMVATLVAGLPGLAGFTVLFLGLQLKC